MCVCQIVKQLAMMQHMNRCILYIPIATPAHPYFVEVRLGMSLLGTLEQGLPRRCQVSLTATCSEHKWPQLKVADHHMMNLIKVAKTQH